MSFCDAEKGNYKRFMANKITQNRRLAYIKYTTYNDKFLCIKLGSIF